MAHGGPPATGRISDTKARLAWAFGLAIAVALLGASCATGAVHVRAPVGHPRLVYSEPGSKAEPGRVGNATLVRGATITVNRPELVRQVTFVVDEPKGGTAVFAVDRGAPFVLPRKGTAGRRPYALGPHNLRAEVELRSGKRIRLEVNYLTATLLPVGASTDSGSFERAIASMPAGPVLVRPADGAPAFAVTGDVTMTRPLVVVERAQVTGTVTFRPESTGSRLLNSSARGFDIFGADDIVLAGNTFDGQGVDNQNIIWDEPAGNTPDGWVLRGNTFQNFYVDEAESHSEALFIGYSTNGLIDGNTFTNNGTTSHIFFTWFGFAAQPGVSYPRNICLRGNTFNARHNAFYDVAMRDEIPSSANIRVQRNAAISNEAFYGSC